MSDVKGYPGYLDDGPLGIIDLPDDADGRNALPPGDLRADRRGFEGSDGSIDERRVPAAERTGSSLKTWLLGGAALVIVVGGMFVAIATHRHPERFIMSGARGHGGGLDVQTVAISPTQNNGLQPAQLAHSGAPGGGRANAPATAQPAAKQAPGALAGAAQDETLLMVSTLELRLQEMGQKDQALAEQLVQTNQGFQAQLAALNAKVAQLEATDNAAISAATKIVSAPAAFVVRAPVRAPEPVQPTIAPSSYAVEAASPGVAIVVRDGSAIQVGVGDTVPGVGKVTSIDQSGTGWTVHTTAGEIN